MVLEWAPAFRASKNSDIITFRIVFLFFTDAIKLAKSDAYINIPRAAAQVMLRIT